VLEQQLMALALAGVGELNHGQALLFHGRLLIELEIVDFQLPMGNNFDKV
jgi:hypothetical protein